MVEDTRAAKLWRLLKPVRPLYFFILAALLLVVGILAARQNYIRMVELREEVYIADRENGDVATALTALQQHVTSHMNTNLNSGSNTIYPPIQLKFTYERLRESSIRANNEQLYVDAQNFCEQQNPNDFSGRNRVPCIQEFVESRGVRQQPVPESLYKYSFVSPVWSPDLAGFSLLGAFLSTLFGVVLILIRRRVRNMAFGISK